MCIYPDTHTHIYIHIYVYIYDTHTYVNAPKHIYIHIYVYIYICVCVRDLLFTIKMKVAQLCLTLCDPMDYVVNGILQGRIPEWVAFPFSRGSS